MSIPPAVVYMRYIKSVLLGTILVGTAEGLENGVGRTPPMGFISWERFGAETNCDKFPKTCISETLYTSIADAMVEKGLVELGYVYVNIDDNWSEKERGADGRLQESKSRFPRGMTYLADYLHSKGMKFGMYTDVGTKTCQGYPGLLKPGFRIEKPGSFFFESDIDMFLEWGIDALKVDGCNARLDYMHILYPALSEMILRKIAERREAEGKSQNLPLIDTAKMALDESSEASKSRIRDILLSCSWPAYMPNQGEDSVSMTALMKHCNLWRNYGDIQDSEDSVLRIERFFARRGPNDIMVKAAGPGHWNDPDMLVIGNKGLSISQQQAQFCIWAILAAPLYISADVREMSPESLAILKNKQVIDVNQDPLGRQGWVAFEDQIFRLWVRPLSAKDGHSRVAFVVENKRVEFGASDFVMDPKLLGVSGEFWLNDLLNEEPPEARSAGQKPEIRVDENCVRMFVLNSGEVDLQILMAWTSHGAKGQTVATQAKKDKAAGVWTVFWVAAPLLVLIL